MEPSYWILLGTYSHTQIQKVRGWVGKFFVNAGYSTGQMVAGLKILSIVFWVNLAAQISVKFITLHRAGIQYLVSGFASSKMKQSCHCPHLRNTSAE